MRICRYTILDLLASGLSNSATIAFFLATTLALGDADDIGEGGNDGLAQKEKTKRKKMFVGETCQGRTGPFFG